MGTIDLVSFWTIFVKHSYVFPVLSDNVQQINPTNCLCNYFVRQKTPPQHDDLKKLSSPIPLSRKPYMRLLSPLPLGKNLLIIYFPEKRGEDGRQDQNSMAITNLRCTSNITGPSRNCHPRHSGSKTWPQLWLPSSKTKFTF